MIWWLFWHFFGKNRKSFSATARRDYILLPRFLAHFVEELETKRLFLGFFVKFSRGALGDVQESVDHGLCFRWRVDGFRNVFIEPVTFYFY